MHRFGSLHLRVWARNVLYLLLKAALGMKPLQRLLFGCWRDELFM